MLATSPTAAGGIGALDVVIPADTKAGPHVLLISQALRRTDTGARLPVRTAITVTGPGGPAVLGVDPRALRPVTGLAAQPVVEKAPGPELGSLLLVGLLAAALVLIVAVPIALAAGPAHPGPGRPGMTAKRVAAAVALAALTALVARGGAGVAQGVPVLLDRLGHGHPVADRMGASQHAVLRHGRLGRRGGGRVRRLRGGRQPQRRPGPLDRSGRHLADQRGARRPCVSWDRARAEPSGHLGRRGLHPRYDYPKKTSTAGPRIATSTDGGKTFGDPVNPLKSYQPEVPELRSFTAYLTLAGDGTVYALITADEPGDELTRPVIATSTDRGKTFTVADAGPAYPYFPRTAMEWSPQGGPQGTLHLVYEHKPDVPPAAGDTEYYTYSLDNGATWAKNLRITDISSNRRLGTWAGNFDQRGPPGLASADAFAVLGWDDTRLGDATTQTQDVFATSVQFAPIIRGEESGAAAYALAVAGGVGAAGLLLLVCSPLLRRRRT